MKLNFDVIVIGCGCAGMTAAIYLKRANKKVLIIEDDAPGGQINKTSVVDNYPGFVNIDGPNLASNMFIHIQELGILYKKGKVISVVEKTAHKIVKTENEEITCKAIIIATGRKPRQLGLNNEKELAGKGISWCSICDAPLFKGKDIVVVGGGNSALEESLHLAEYVNSITLIHRKDEFRGDKVLQSRITNNDKINIVYDSEIINIKETNGFLSGVEIKNLITKEIQQIKVSGLFIYIGFEPATSIFKSMGIKVDEDYIIVDENMRTSINHVYACGDVIKKELYQIATAVGEGAKAAVSAIKDLE